MFQCNLLTIEMTVVNLTVDLITCLVVTNDQKSLHNQPIMLIVLQASYCAQNSASILWKGLMVILDVKTFSKCKV